jgi:GNAT superfamily N-acetyltransferase
VELMLVQSPADFKREDNRRRAEIGGKNSLTNQFAAWEHGEEVGFLSLDIYPPDQHPDIDWYTIYEIFVPRPLRSKGIGTRLLEAAEQAGREIAGYGMLAYVQSRWTTAEPRSNS